MSTLLDVSKTDDVLHNPPQSQETPVAEAASDDALMTAYVGGDIGAFDTLYIRHKAAVFRFFTRQLPAAQAHDGFQETWTKLIATSARYEAKGAFQGFLFRIAHNVLIDHYRQLTRAGIVETEMDELVAQESNPADGADKEQLSRLLYREIAKLPIAQRTVWVMKQESELSIAEIAALSGASEEGVKSRLRYANEKLTAGMQRYVRP